MKLNIIGPNCHELETESFRILFSYGMPVAVLSYVEDYPLPEYHIVDLGNDGSVTTSKHINRWVKGLPGGARRKEDVVSIDIPEFHATSLGRQV